MTERVAILGWGSLLWDGGPAFDAQHDPWRCDGPELRIEFSRISATRGGALTLAIDAENGAPTQVAWCLSRRATIGEAIEDLRVREGAAARHIGNFSIGGGVHYRDGEAFAVIRVWASTRGLDGVVWTDLPSNFMEIAGQPFSVAAGIAYLQSLNSDSRARAMEYIWRAPDRVRTPLREAFAQTSWVQAR
jgi:hypothetical protein